MAEDHTCFKGPAHWPFVFYDKLHAMTDPSITKLLPRNGETLRQNLQLIAANMIEKKESA